MDTETLAAMLDFGRARLLNSLSTIEKTAPDVNEALAWRPGAGRAHIAWQAMHCAATLDKYLNINIGGGKAKHEAIVAAYGGGSTPLDQNIPGLADIRAALEGSFQAFRRFVASVTPEEQARPLANGRTVAESIALLIWHEAHHQGQIHLTWNLYKAAHGIG